MTGSEGGGSPYASLSTLGYLASTTDAMRKRLTNRRLFYLGVLIACMMSSLLMYLAYHDVFSSHPGDLVSGDPNGLGYDLNGSAPRPNKGSLGSPLWWENDQEEEEEEGPSATPESPWPPQVRAYQDTELSEHLQDMHENHVMNRPHQGPESRDKEEAFVYPVVGYEEFRRHLRKDQPQPLHSKQISTMNDPAEGALRLHSNEHQGMQIHANQMPYSKNEVSRHNIPVREFSHKVTEKTPGLNSRGGKRKPGVLPPPLKSYPSQNQGGSDVKYLVYLCDKVHWCGGWGDRQRGITSMYLLSRLIDRQLKLMMDTPCNLTDFYIPHKVQWTITPGEVQSLPHLIVNGFTNSQFRLSLKDGDFNLKYPQQVIYVKTNQDYYLTLRKNPFYASKIDRWSGLKNKRDRFRWAWRDLMQPSPHLLTRLEAILGPDILVRKGLIKKSLFGQTNGVKSSNFVGASSLICAHVRVGKNPTIPMDESFDTFKLTDIPILQNFLQSKDVKGTARIFLATDYEYIRQQFQEFFGKKLIDYGGKIIHIDRQRNELSACTGFEVALLDQLILSVCDVLVVSRSGFSLHASHVSNSTGPIYILEDGRISPLKL